MILSTLALGIGATTVMFTVINGVLLKPLPYPEFDRLVTIEGKTEKYGTHPGVSYPNYVDAKQASASFATMSAWSYSSGTISRPGDPEHVEGRQISADLFDVFGIPLSHGRAFLAAEDRVGAPPVAIIGDGLWQRRFAGSPAAVGSQLVFDGRPYTIVGVAPAGFQLDGDAEVFTPLGQVTEVRLKNRSADFLRSTELAFARPSLWRKLKVGSHSSRATLRNNTRIRIKDSISRHCAFARSWLETFVRRYGSFWAPSVCCC